MEEKELKLFLEKVLRNFEKDEGLVINDLKKTEGSKPGDGFMSEVFGVVVVGRTGLGEAYTNNLFIKQLPNNPTRVELCQGDAAFQNEAIFYRDLEPLIPKATSFIPICYHADEKCLVLENLRTQGYEMADKENGLDLKRSELVMKAMAKFHACTLDLKIKNEKKFSKISSSLRDLYSDENSLHCKGIEMSLDRAIECLKSLCDESISDGIKKLESFRGKTFSLLVERKPSNLAVLGHGDFWLNNFMFKDDAIMVIDYQALRPMSISADFWKFIYSSLTPENIEKHLDQLMSLYYRTFVEHLNKLQFPSDQIPDEQTVKEELTSQELYGLFIAIAFMALLYMDFSEINMDQMLSDESLFQPNPKIVKKCGTRLAALVKMCERRNVL